MTFWPFCRLDCFQKVWKTFLTHFLRPSGSHWKEVFKKYERKDFKSKINKIFWRGTTTGSKDRPGNRFDLVTKWFNKDKNIDVGFSFTTQGGSNYKKFVKNFEILSGKI